jgi:putative hydrolase of the HAD superfamily
LFDDVIPCIKELKGYRLGIISNGDLKQQSLKLDRLGIKDRFEIITTSGEAGIAKPNIEIFKTACSRADENPENCCYVGDDFKTDILPCRETGMYGIWLNRESGQRRVSDIVAINTLHNLKDILT